MSADGNILTQDVDPIHITERALAVIRRALAHSAEMEPVVYLVEASTPMPVHPDLADAMLSGADPSVIEGLIRKIPHQDPNVLRRRLVPTVFSRAQLATRYIAEVQGIAFYLPPHPRVGIRGCTLDLEDGTLILRNEHGEVVLPSPR